MNRVFSKLLPLAAILLLPAFAQAQETASSMRGRVIDQDGAPVAGASVVVTDMRTGVSNSFRTNDTGTFLAPRLPVGGPYQVSVEGGDPVDVSYIALGEPYNLTVLVERTIEEIITTGRIPEKFDTAIGPAATFGLQDLDAAVAFERDIKEVYAVDPRMSLDFDGRGTQTNCLGKHPRFNSTTLDGVSHNDRFGLNNNGYSTATGMPFPYDAIQQVSVELAPFDPKYGGFSACNINAVTKSGTNEYVANVFYEFTDQSLIADELDGLDLSAPEDYTREKIGLSIGGPIIQDRLHFFAAYEETEQPLFLAMGYAGSGNGEERPWLSQADFNAIDAAAQSLWNYDTGGMPGNGSLESENYLVRLDWQINDAHSLTGIYNYYDGAETRASDGDSNEFEFANHFYTKGAESTTTTFWLDSQWTDSFSSQIYYSDSRMNDSQVTVGPKEMGDHQIELGNNTIYLGADDSRQANRLFTDSELIKVSGLWLAGDHAISVGYEREELRVFNIFVQHSNGGEWDYWDDSSGNPAACDALDAQGRHDDPTCGTTGVDKFVLGRPSRVYYGSGGGSNNPIDAAADFVNVKNSLYLADEIYFPNSDFTLTAGLRFDWFTSDDSPNYNDALSTAIGIRNDAGLDGLNILMPRLGFNWGVNDTLTLRGGAGLFSGGNPNVWVSNAWSNDGITNVQERENYFGNVLVYPGGDEPLTQTGGGGLVPTTLYDEVAATDVDSGSIFFTTLLDPNYEMPREWKYSLGATWELPWGGWTADIDYMYTILKKGAIYNNVSQEIVGTTTAGAPIYDAIPGTGENNLMLTNANKDSTAEVISVVLNKSWDWGMDLLFGYAWTDARDVSPMTSFTSGSSFDNLATNDINNPRPGPSNYVRRNRLTMRMDYAREFFGDNLTRFTLIGFYQEGQPNSYTLDSFDVLQEGRSRRHLLYVPDGPSDPNVVYDANFPVAEFFDWIKARGLKGGQFAPRNSVTTSASSRVDLRVDQEIPLGMSELKGRVFLKIYNFTNLLNDDWGWQYDSEFFSRDVVDVSGLTPSGQYIYEDFSARNPTSRDSFRSLWEVRLGLDIRFR
ncbi:MAG: TonB-dependent receptor [Woeseiaceae bacterium]|nr:TonB-dependent receptor [Woeseiaceae bacterium]NIP21890.1 TonB-dependent receptor [Woeseiaceae bacterium]NIS90975.1 TonB-dependent receptor [Woeseiaceae bacterium]